MKKSKIDYSSGRKVIFMEGTNLLEGRIVSDHDYYCTVWVDGSDLPARKVYKISVQLTYNDNIEFCGEPVDQCVMDDPEDCTAISASRQVCHNILHFKSLIADGSSWLNKSTLENVLVVCIANYCPRNSKTPPIVVFKDQRHRNYSLLCQSFLEQYTPYPIYP